MDDIINKTLEYVYDYFSNDYSGHDFYHTLRVYNLAKAISEKEGGDIEIISLASLLHDVDDRKLVKKGQEPFYNTKLFLESCSYPKEKIDTICHIISQVSFKGRDTERPNSIEGMIVQDADRLDALGAISVARTFAYAGNHDMPIHIPEAKLKMDMSSEEYYNNENTAINHFYEKILKLKDLMNTNTAKELAIHRHKYVEEFLEEFFLEWDGIK